MTTRYAMLTAFVVAVALLAGLVVHEVAGSTKYVSDCEFQLALPLSATQPSSDILVFNRRQAADELARAQLGSVYTEAARKSGVPAGEIPSDQSIFQASDSSFELTTETSSASSAVKLANALCDAYVRQLTAQVQGEEAAEQHGLRNQIDGLEARLRQLVKKYGVYPAPAVAQYEQATKSAIARNRDYLTVALSLPPYNISVLSYAQGAGLKSTKPSLSKSLIIGAAAGLLISFLLILVLETTRKRPAREL